MSTLIDRDNELKFLKNMTDDQAYANALSDPDNPPLTEEQLATVVRLRDVPGETLLEKFRVYGARAGSILRPCPKENLVNGQISKFVHSQGFLH